jgi:hypothetical protein
MTKTIVSCAVTGNQTTLEQHPGLPVTPKQIADACIGEAKAGAAIVHIHVCSDDGRPSNSGAVKPATEEPPRPSAQLAGLQFRFQKSAARYSPAGCAADHSA